jgi:hypothetical protein
VKLVRPDLRSPDCPLRFARPGLGLVRACREVEGRARKTPADVAREALVAAGLRAPNQRLFGINDPYAWELFRPEPSMLPPFPPCWLPGVERDQK